MPLVFCSAKKDNSKQQLNDQTVQFFFYCGIWDKNDHCFPIKIIFIGKSMVAVLGCCVELYST